ncbi:MAG TPA: YfcE family phosphodiesterase [Candidatus Acidoferrales bacterium]|nr:YfcE family phosphodiesterase [Candidatus Acidoferrales bacterium]
MKIVIASDLHGNLEALAILPRNYDQLWILGDLVNYGPDPAEVVDYVRLHAAHVVRGNHDHAVACGEDPRCPGRLHELAKATGKFTQDQLPPGDRQYLCGLPLQMELQMGQTRFWLCHATPSDPLYGYAPAASEKWSEECNHVPADILLVGHTHAQFMKKVGNCLLVNPGSLGQPNNRNALACYAVWENGIMSLCSTAYAVETTVAKVQGLPASEVVRSDLVTLLRTGRLAEVPTRDASQVCLQG